MVIPISIQFGNTPCLILPPALLLCTLAMALAGIPILRTRLRTPWPLIIALTPDVIPPLQFEQARIIHYPETLVTRHSCHKSKKPVATVLVAVVFVLLFDPEVRPTRSPMSLESLALTSYTMILTTIIEITIISEDPSMAPSLGYMIPPDLL